jgi:hypothetical protein
MALFDWGIPYVCVFERNVFALMQWYKDGIDRHIYQPTQTSFSMGIFVRGREAYFL